MSDTLNSQNGATTTHYAYDVNDQRVSMDTKKGGATTTTKYYNQFYETTGATTTMYIYAGGQLLATIEGNGKSTTTALVHSDHQGSTNVTSSASGTLLTLNTYYSYGDLRQNQKNTATFDEKKKAVGQYYDDATNLGYYNARYIKNSNGQFISEDPVSANIGMMIKMPAYLLMMNQSGGTIDQTQLLSDPQLLNFYSYARSNPVTMSDPSGLGPEQRYTAVPLAVGFVTGAGISITGQFALDTYSFVQTGQNPYSSVGEQIKAYGAVGATGGVVGAASEVAAVKGALAAVGAAGQSLQNDWAKIKSGDKTPWAALTDAAGQAATAFTATAILEKYLPGVPGRLPGWKSPVLSKHGQDTIVRNAVPATASVVLAAPQVGTPDKKQSK